MGQSNLYYYYYLYLHSRSRYINVDDVTSSSFMIFFCNNKRFVLLSLDILFYFKCVHKSPEGIYFILLFLFLLCAISFFTQKQKSDENDDEELEFESRSVM